MAPTSSHPQRLSPRDPVTLSKLGLLLLVSMLCISSGHSQTFVWDNDNANSTWASDGNWDIIGIPGSGDTATFNGSEANPTAAIDLGAGVSVDTISFATASASAYTLGTSGTQTITLDNDGTIQLDSAVTNNQTIDASLFIEDATLSNASTSAILDVNGDITKTGSSDETLIVDGDGEVTLDGVIGDGSGGGTLSLTKNGTGTLLLSGENTFTGVVDINAGVLQVAPAAAGTTPTTLGTGAASVTLGGGTLEFISDTTNIDWDRAITVDGDSTLRASRTGSAGSAATTYRNGSLSIGAHTLTLERGANFSGNNISTFRFDTGMTLTGNATFAPGERATLQIVGGTSGTGHSITLNGAVGNATLRLGGTGDWDGGTTVTNGTLRIDSANGLGANGTSGSPTITTMTGGNLDLRHHNAAQNNRRIVVNGNSVILLRRNTSETFSIGDLVHQSGNLQIRAGRSGDANATPTITLNNDIELNNGGNLDLEGLFDESILIYNGVISEANGTSSLIIEDTGTVQLGAVSTYSGTTTIDNGTLRLGIDNALPVGTGKGNLSFSVDNSGETGTFDLNGFDQTLRRLDTVGGALGDEIVDNTSATDLSTLTVGNDNAGSTWAGVIQSTGAGGLALVKTGTGNATFTGANTYTGTTTINDGQLRIGNGGSTGSLSSSSTITVNGDGLFVVNRDNDVTQGADFADGISGDGGFQNRGTGTTTLTTNTYTGETRIINGILRAGGTSAFGTNSFVTVDAGGTLRLNGNSNTIGHLIGDSAAAVDNEAVANATLTLGANDESGDFAGVISDGTGGGTLSITKTGTGTQTLSGLNTYTGATTASEGTLELTGSFASDITFADGTALLGEGSTTGSLTLGDGTGSSGVTLTVDASTSGAFTSNGLTSVATGGNHVVNFSGTPAGSDDIVILDFGSGSFTGNVSDFTAGSGAPTGTRAGAGDFATVGNTLVFQTGISELTWVGGVDSNWDINNTANWTGDDTVYFDGDIVNFDGSAANKTVQVNGANIAPTTINFLAGSGAYTLSSANNETITIGSGGLNLLGNVEDDDITITAELVGSGVVTKGVAGPNGTNIGQLFINNDNSDFTGTTLIVSGDIQLDHVNGLGNDASNTITIEDNGDDGRLILSDRNETFVNDIVISNTGNNKIIRFDDGNETVARALTMTGTIFMQETNNSLVFDAEGQNETLGNTHVLTVDSLITSVLDNQDGNIVKGDGGTVIFGNALNDFTGRLYVNAGTLRIGSIGNIGEISHAGRSSAAFAFDIRLGQGQNTGTIVYTGAGDETTDRQVRIGVVATNPVGGGYTGGGIIRNDSSDNSSLTFSNAAFNDPETISDGRVGIRTLTLAGTSTATNEISGVIADNFAAIAVDVDTDGAWRLGGANTYTGATTVNSGTLLVDGSTTAASAVTVDAGATLGGTGTINGATTLAAGANITGGESGSTGTLTFGSNLDTSGSTWLVDLAQDVNGDADLFIVDGNLDIASATFQDQFTGTFTQGNTYTVASYTGTLSGSFSNWSDGLERSLGGGRYLIDYGTGTNSAITLTAVPEPTTFLLLLPLLLAGFWMMRRHKQPLKAGGTEA